LRILKRLEYNADDVNADRDPKMREEEQPTKIRFGNRLVGQNCAAPEIGIGYGTGLPERICGEGGLSFERELGGCQAGQEESEN
jgi:hypothetical protein